VSFLEVTGALLGNSEIYNVQSQLERHVYARSEAAFRAGDAARDELHTAQDIRKRQQFIRSRFIQSIGGLPETGSPLNAKVTGVVREKGFRIEKVIFESRPKVYVTACMYIPDSVASPSAAVLFLCGHGEQAKAYHQYQLVCRHLVKAGLIVLAQDPVGQGERFSYYDEKRNLQLVQWGTSEHEHAGCQCFALGDGIARYFLHDAMRGVDYLASRPEVDASRIGVTGNSGGGTQTSMMMMADKRIAAAAPGTFVMNRKSYMYAGQAQDAEQIWPGFTRLGLDHEDFIIAMAPRPVRVLGVKYDFFPIEGARSTVKRCKRIYKLMGAQQNLSMVEDVSRHMYTQNLAVAAAEFFSQHLLGRKVTPSQEGTAPIEPSALNCTEKGQVSASIRGARFVFDENLQRFKTFAAKRSRDKALKWLRQRIMGDRTTHPTNVKEIWSGSWDGLCASTLMWWTQSGILNGGLLLRESGESQLPVTVALWERGCDGTHEHFDWVLKTCKSGRAVLVVDVVGWAAIQPNALNHRDKRAFYGTIHLLNNNLMWLGDSLTAMRAYDLTRLPDAIAEIPGVTPRGLKIHTEGRTDVWAELAGAVDHRLADIESINGMGTYANWVSSREYASHAIHDFLMPGLLQYCDLDDLRKWRIKARKR